MVKCLLCTRRQHIARVMLTGWLAVTMAGPAAALQAPPPTATDGTFTVRGSIGMLEGRAGEYVYIGPYTLSELLWDISGVVMAGVTASWRVHTRWSLNAGAWSALNTGNGEMTDKDYRLPGFDWTDFSRSEVDVERGLAFDINAGFRLNQHGRVALTALVGYRQDIWEWTDRAQEFVYSDAGFRDWRGHFGGINAIDYKQTFRIPYAGLHVGGPAGTRFHWQAYAIGSVFGSAEAHDHHILRGLHFEDTFSGLTYLALGIAAGLELTARTGLELALHIQHIPESTGDGYIVEDDTHHPDGAGIALDTAKVSLAVTHRF